MTQVKYDIELQPGEPLHLPQSVVDQVGPGHWRITISPVKEEESTTKARGHLQLEAPFNFRWRRPTDRR